MAGTQTKSKTDTVQLSELKRNTEMSPTRLIQRLEMPRTNIEPNPFNFGAGRFGGFSYDALKDLNKILNFSYMGAAEYENGAVPKSVETLWEWGQQNALVMSSMKLDGSEIFYICNKDMENGVKSTIRRLAHNKRRFTLDYVGLDDILTGKRPKPSKPRDLAGWLELDNHFMFFVDKTMFENSVKLFTINVAQKDKIKAQAKPPT